MSQTKYVDRAIHQISLADFENRIGDITAELVDAAENVGFFTPIDHGLSKEDTRLCSSHPKAFSTYPTTPKRPFHGTQTMWDGKKNSQVRPSTGMPDSKESYQLQFGENMKGLWVGDDHLPGFGTISLEFMQRMQKISECLMRCFARGLGFPDDFFIKCHDVPRPDSQTTMRLLHYFALPEEADGKVYHRAGAHADLGFQTLLFQKEG